MSNRKFDPRVNAQPRPQRSYVLEEEDEEEMETVVVARHPVPARAALRKAATSAPQTTGSYTRLVPSQVVDDEEDAYEAEPPPLPKSVIRYSQPQRPVSQGAYDPTYNREQRRGFARFMRKHPGLAMALAAALTAGVFVLGVNVIQWGHYAENRWSGGPHYTVQVAQAVSQNGDSLTNPSHFVATDVQGILYVFEIAPNGKVTYYPVEALSSDQVQISLVFKDVNGDGKLDMEVQVEGLPTLILLNDGTKFDSPMPGMGQ